ncbi:hypothetical protein [Labrenzia sp. 011]|uniref:hypothetical protein n=1 Tax=Labrenzia sp. 011 TaxID=2171494 RepID=UPI0014036800|nr:hypothetical protein [Labrenzia sp. 011]
MYQFLSTIIKMAVISLLAGAGLSLIDISAEDILSTVGLGPEALWIYLNLFRPPSA